MSKRVTIKDIAKAAKVSIATVSYVINGVGNVTDETRKRVMEIIEKMEYKPNLAARSLVKKQSRVIGILIPMSKKAKRTLLMDNPFYLEFFTSLQFRAIEYGYSVLLIDTEEREETISMINNGSLFGVIILGMIEKYIHENLKKSGIPVVVIDQDKTNDNYMYIKTDDEMATYMAIEYLIKKGHKNIAILSGKLDIGDVHRRRFEGYKRALSDYNIPLNDRYIIQEDVSHDGGIRTADSVKNLIPDVTAVFSMSDIMAMGLIKGLFDRKVYVPYDISVMGFDNIKMSGYFIPNLTTINQNISLKGELAVDMILGKMKGINKNKRVIIVPVSLIEGHSVKEFNK